MRAILFRRVSVGTGVIKFEKVVDKVSREGFLSCNSTGKIVVDKSLNVYHNYV